jgi:crotonobetainyl-CoA:carnitine CoA-transferase CaiB-like acyl-CoA transferase
MASPSPAGASPLEGVREHDLTQVVSGPICGRALADLGADVIKIESPAGDVSRTVDPAVGGKSLYFTHLNAGKRDVCIDVRTAPGADLVARLAERSDVLLENFRPGALARRGLGATDLMDRNPRLVYCSVSGWGQHGPWAQRRAYAPLVHAEAGRMELASRLRGTPPQQEVHVHGDVYPGLVAVSAVLAALYQREHTGRGQHLDIAMAEVLVYTDEWSSTDLAGYPPERSFDIWTHPVATVADGTGVALVGNPARQFDQWVDALSEAPIARHGSDDAALAIVRELVAAVADFATLEARLEHHPMLVAELRSVAELAATPWAREREVFAEIEPGARVAAAPFRSAHAHIGVRGPAPRKGQHTRATLAELLGLGDPALDALEATGAIVQHRERQDTVNITP